MSDINIAALGGYVLDQAVANGWKAGKGEDAFTFMMRRTREVALDDAKGKYRSGELTYLAAPYSVSDEQARVWTDSITYKEAIKIPAAVEFAQQTGDYTQIKKYLIEQRMKLLSQLDAQLMEKGFFTISPCYKHLMRQHVQDVPGDWSYWGEYSEALMLRCDKLIVLCLDGWEQSTGVQAEIVLALENRIPVYYVRVVGDGVFSAAEMDPRCASFGGPEFA